MWSRSTPRSASRPWAWRKNCSRCHASGWRRLEVAVTRTVKTPSGRSRSLGVSASGSTYQPCSLATWRSSSSLALNFLSSGSVRRSFTTITRSATYAVGSPAEPSATGERAGSSTRAWTVARRAGCGSRGARAGSARRLGGMFSPFEKGYRSDLECGGAEGLAVRQLEPQPVEAGGQLGELEASVHVGRSVIGALLTLDLAHLH